MPAGYALVTGASEGLGREFAALAARSGRGVILVARQKDKIEALARDLGTAHGTDVVALPADLSRLEEAERVWAEAAADRRIEVLVNNAGLGRNGRFDDGGWPRERASIDVNLVAATYLMKQAVAHMLAMGGGKVLNVASLAAFTPGPNMAVYHATKAYLLSLSEAVAEELRGRPVTVTALCPGATRTNFFADADLEGGMLLNRLPMPTAASVAEAGWRAMIAGRTVVVPGLQNSLSAFLPRLVPRPLTARIAALLLRRRP